MKGGSPEGPGSRSPLALVGIGVELVAPVLIGIFGGRWLDGLLGTEPWLLVTGALLGIGAGFYNFFRAVLGSTRGDPT